ncbi:HYC_CC_PP family protein [Aequorivita marina]|uniref:HYC_CC_PP family protein n=1 Tax=Aequorivita marina TaxID=3073654 RepID=UPI002875F864|nr:hypothetical protein [Aequorivita sp. S2608]MDS1299608.1 hypothetical protein [Aequorivita sp. S2608]
MKSFLHKTMAICMASLVLFTTMSFTVDVHYCGDMMVDFSVVQNATTCGMEHQPAENDCHNEVQDDSCCTDKQIVLEGQDEVKTTFHNLTFEQQTFVATFFYTYIKLFEDLDTNIVPFSDYKPPLLIRDIQKLHETYLI